MARITPAEARISSLELEDDASYKATITAIDWSTSSEEFGSEKRLQVDFLPDGAEDGDTVRDWFGLRLGRAQNGAVSKLRQLLNAVAGQPSTAEIKWFDDETAEWSYDGEKPFSKLAEGMEVIFEGANGQKRDGTPIYRIQRYKKVPAAAPATGKPKAKPLQPVGVTQDVDPDSIPF